MLALVLVVVNGESPNRNGCETKSRALGDYASNRLSSPPLIGDSILPFEALISRSTVGIEERLNKAIV